MGHQAPRSVITIQAQLGAVEQQHLPRRGVAGKGHGPQRSQRGQSPFDRCVGAGLNTRPYATFLRAVVGNMMLEEARRTQRTLSHLPEDEPTAEQLAMAEGWTPGTPLPDAASISNQEAAVVRDYLASLSPAEQAFVRVRFEEGASQRDAAEALGLGRQAVRTLEKKARDGLRAFVQQWHRPRNSANPEP